MCCSVPHDHCKEIPIKLWKGFIKGRLEKRDTFEGWGVHICDFDCWSLSFWHSTFLMLIYETKKRSYWQTYWRNICNFWQEPIYEPWRFLIQLQRKYQNKGPPTTDPSNFVVIWWDLLGPLVSLIFCEKAIFQKRYRMGGSKVDFHSKGRVDYRTIPSESSTSSLKGFVSFQCEPSSLKLLRNFEQRINKKKTNSNLKSKGHIWQCPLQSSSKISHQ